MTSNRGAATAGRAGVPGLLGTQLLFNVGFYAVVPFIAVVLAEDFGLASAAVGLVLGVRTFAQQGMFLVGGVLADRFGARSTILVGCAVRIAGFFTLAASLWASTPLLWLFVVGTVLTGLGGALFSPGLNVLVATAEVGRATSGPRVRASLFAWLTMAGEVGAVTGPLVGAALLGWGFAVVAASGAVFFVAIGLYLSWALPAPAPRVPRVPRREDSTSKAATRRGPAALRERRFVAFAALHSVDLLAYNQLYLALPLELRRAEAAPQLVGFMFAWVSILTLALQLPVARWCARVGPERALRCGYAAGATGFLVVAAGALAPASNQTSLVSVLVATTFLTLGHLTAHPTALSLVPRFAGAHPTGSYFGLLATFGGVAVLVGNLVVGGLLGNANAGPVAAALPWLFLALPLGVSAAWAPRVLIRSVETDVPSGQTPPT